MWRWCWGGEGEWCVEPCCCFRTGAARPRGPLLARCLWGWPSLAAAALAAELGEAAVEGVLGGGEAVFDVADAGTAAVASGAVQPGPLGEGGEQAAEGGAEGGDGGGIHGVGFLASLLGLLVGLGWGHSEGVSSSLASESSLAGSSAAGAVVGVGVGLGCASFSRWG